MNRPLENLASAAKYLRALCIDIMTPRLLSVVPDCIKLRVKGTLDQGIIDTFQQKPQTGTVNPKALSKKPQISIRKNRALPIGKVKPGIDKFIPECIKPTVQKVSLMITGITDTIQWKPRVESNKCRALPRNPQPRIRENNALPRKRQPRIINANREINILNSFNPKRVLLYLVIFCGTFKTIKAFATGQTGVSQRPDGFWPSPFASLSEKRDGLLELKVFIGENLNDTLKMKRVTLHFPDCRLLVTSQPSNKCNVTLRVQDDFFTISGKRSSILPFYQMHVEEKGNASVYHLYDVAGLNNESCVDNRTLLQSSKASLLCVTPSNTTSSTNCSDTSTDIKYDTQTIFLIVIGLSLAVFFVMGGLIIWKKWKWLKSRIARKTVKEADEQNTSGQDTVLQPLQAAPHANGTAISAGAAMSND